MNAPLSTDTYDVSNLLNWPDWTIDTVEETDRTYTISATPPRRDLTCTKCGLVDPIVYRFATAQPEFRDTPIHGKLVTIKVTRQRYRCRACSGTFFAPLPEMLDSRRMTRRLMTYVLDRAIRQPFIRVAEDTGLNEWTVRSIFTSYVQSLANAAIFQSPRVLGIDEVWLGHKPRGVMTNVENKAQLLDLMPDNLMATVVERLLRFEGREAIEVVTMDMHQPYRSAVELILPQAAIVVDKFHVVRAANKVVNDFRVQLRKELQPEDARRRGLRQDKWILQKRRKDLTFRQELWLDSWQSVFPELYAMYELKEQLFEIYGAADKSEAQERYDAWCLAILKPLRHCWKPVLTSFENWEPWIFNYFDHKVTNAGTEARNNLIRAIDRGGFGYSFEVLRAKALLRGRDAVVAPERRRKRKEPPLDIPDFFKWQPDMAGWPMIDEGPGGVHPRWIHFNSLPVRPAA